MVSDLLSQDEINALLSQTSNSDNSDSAAIEATSNITETVNETNPFLVIREKVFEKFVDSSKSILSELLMGDVECELVDITQVLFSDFINKVIGKNIKFDSKFLDSFTGNFSIYLNHEFFGIVGALMNGEEEKVQDTFSEMYLSAVNEAVNQIISSGLNVISKDNGSIPVSIDLPEVNEIEVAEGYKDENINSEECISVEFKLSFKDYKDKYLIFLFSKETCDSIKNAVDKKEEPTPATETAVSSPAPPSAPVAPSAPAVQIPIQKPEPELTDDRQKKIQMLLDVPIKLSVDLGKNNMLVKDILNLGIGSILELDKSSSEPVNLVINNKPIARGDVVVVDENFGLRITELVPPYERLNILKRK